MLGSTLDLCDSSNTCEHQQTCGKDAGVGLEISIRRDHDTIVKPKNALLGECSLARGEAQAIDTLSLLLAVALVARGH